ncbi:MAG: ATP-binding protein [Oscillatoriaceae bacterium SKW80]|nr:ATP-binding protein [Oscillatoriaceae bacterium SKYG93]MCX8120120.1 ATP-binding protein [Oscillatoriaceae bacterium SKW80]MDW8453046.1 ATP-binding protein [Oscillatoriaceae cyanobacterium SKYGB_i_bin93]HIK29043.1 ATP-binding protein [Oscillatoriaceae cyanobacterium M7585_C2015_266]
MILENFESWWKTFTSQLGIQQKKTVKWRRRSHLQVGTDLKALAEVLQWFEQFNLPCFPANLWWQCQTALAEGFTNAVRHAHSDLPESTPIDIDVEICDRYLEIKIWDRGKPFDLEAKLASISQEEFDPLERENGRGLIFIRKLTDEVCYTRTPDQRNCLLMRKNFRL